MSLIAFQLGILYLNIAATAEEDERSAELAFTPADYPTHEEAMAALRAWIHEIAERVNRNASSEPGVDASR